VWLYLDGAHTEESVDMIPAALDAVAHLHDCWHGLFSRLGFS
jgi:hypothetical protein